MTRAYIAWLGLDLSFQKIGRELAEFAVQYADPQGLFLLACRGQQCAGKFSPGICEMKRLYVYDEFQGLGIGRQLCAAIIAAARRLGFTHMRLDTLDRLNAAIGLYESFGFSDIEAYRYNPVPGARYLGLDL